MPIETKITCDYCQRDITYSRGGYDHSLVLSDRKYGPDSQYVFTYYMEPCLDKDKYFCGFGCLKEWLKKQGK